MIHYKKIFLAITITFSIISCGKIKSDNESSANSENNIEKDSTEISTSQKNDSASATTMDESETKGSILSEPDFTKKQDEKIVSETTKAATQYAIKKKKLATPDTNNANSAATKTEVKKISTPSNFTIQKILNGCKTGETLTQEELSKNLEIPKEAIKLVKSITKISENEIDLKWNSTWAVEKISDAEFKDGRLKVRFEDNKMYTSGDAIGIKYKRKIYTDLVVYGRAARIPSVKGFYWKIGKD